MLQNLNLPVVMDTSSFNLVDDFFQPILEKSTSYDRGVGYFSSGWLRVNAKGMLQFATNGGRARWVTSPILSKRDWKALNYGERARRNEYLHKILRKNVSDLAQALEKDVLSALAWMIADGILDFKLALPDRKLRGGDFHDKFGVFTDTQGNQIAFRGSYNESIQGLRNYEGINIFKSWDPALHPFVKHMANRFENLWNNQDPNVNVFDLPQAIRKQILQLRTSNSRPYLAPHEDSTNLIGQQQRDYRPYSLWNHQKDAIKAWEENDRRGLLSMATGSGKTLTSIAAAQQAPNLSLLVVAVPRNNLVDQWNEEIKKFTDFNDPILVYGNSKKWQDRLFGKLRLAHRGKWAEPVIVIGSMSSLSSKRFRSVIEDTGIPNHSMLIADEVHNIGAPTYRKILDTHFQYRLGLSATPERSFDSEGNKAIDTFFKDHVYIYSMRQALEDGRLCPYYYRVYVVSLLPKEYEQYLQYTRKIIALQRNNTKKNATGRESPKNTQEEIEQLLFARARILKKAADKPELLQKIITEYPPKRCLIYCADKEQLQKVEKIVELQNIAFASYFSDTSTKKRKQALEAIEKGHVPLLIAIDCLDEGVDVPTVDSAIILASSSNKRQFIQRRGRILRKSPSKNHATLIDVLVIPPPNVGAEGRWTVKSELARAREMAELAENREDALLQIKSYTEDFGILLTELLNEEKNESV